MSKARFDYLKKFFKKARVKLPLNKSYEDFVIEKYNLKPEGDESKVSVCKKYYISSEFQTLDKDKIDYEDYSLREWLYILCSKKVKKRLIHFLSAEYTCSLKFRMNGFANFIKTRILDMDGDQTPKSLLDSLILEWYDLEEESREMYRRLGQDIYKRYGVFDVPLKEKVRKYLKGFERISILDEQYTIPKIEDFGVWNEETGKRTMDK